MGRYVLAIDQGTTSSRALLFDADCRVAGAARSEEFPQHFPRSGWVEHDPEEIWRTTLATAREALAKAGGGRATSPRIGITNQRETTRRLGARDRASRSTTPSSGRTAARRMLCAGAAAQRRRGAVIAEKTGLLLDPYFSATKIAWMLDNVPGARARGRARRARLRHRRQLPALAADRRARARDRRDQRLAHLLCSTSTPAPGTTSCSRSFACRARCCRRCATTPAEFGATAPSCSAPPSRSAGWPATSRRRPIGQACFAPGHDQVDLRHRLLCRAQHRRQADRLDAIAC